ncbi:mdsC protein [Anopheles sinensis]|uniref:MdsC protein n=1 Tax=Anopheles sinensis TaxID=74873 RepID=A0A084WS15_ANOSI|nr:mdsC protein [Anopheles sinensis]
MAKFSYRAVKMPQSGSEDGKKNTVTARFSRLKGSVRCAKQLITTLQRFRFPFADAVHGPNDAIRWLSADGYYRKGINPPTNSLRTLRSSQRLEQTSLYHLDSDVRVPLLELFIAKPFSNPG